MNPPCDGSREVGSECVITTAGSSIEIEVFQATPYWIDHQLAAQEGVKSVDRLVTANGVTMYRVEHTHDMPDSWFLKDSLWPAVTYFITGSTNAYLVTGAFHPTDIKSDDEALNVIDAIMQTVAVSREK